MSEISERYRRVAAQFTDRVVAVPDDAWDRPAPCEGWVARDVVGHLVEGVPGFFVSYAELDFGPMPSVDDDPAAAWAALDAATRAALAAPDASAREVDTPGGRHTVASAVGMFYTPDVLVHTWDLARATGLDETLDPDEVHALFV